MTAIEKPVTDDRDYKVVTLPNGLEALLISDPGTDKASAAMDVNVGAFSDPEELPGLAHFLEHLLFMGTEKYPSENEYSQYLTDHAGTYNAYTSAEDTNYYFDVAYPFLHGALDRFAQFFIGPLFSQGAKDREIMAVDSENKKNLSSDTWRLYQLDKSLASPAHPYHKFSTGNYATLGQTPESRNIDVRDELIKFHKSHYSAQIMKLTVLGREPLDVLETWVGELFSSVPGPAREPAQYAEPPLGKAQLGTLISARPVMDLKILELAFPVPDQHPQFRSQPSHYFSHLIGHENKDSLLQFFKNKGWANGLSSGSTHVSDGYDFFNVEVELTDKGVEHWKDIVAAVFDFVALLKTTGPQKWVFDELQAMSKASFLYKQKSKPSGTTSNLSRTLQRKQIPRDQILSYSVLHDYEPQLLAEFLNHLNVDNVRVLLVSQALDNLDQTERWYGTAYRVDSISSFLNSLREIQPSGAFKLPHRNDFVPTSFEVSRPDAAPKQPLTRPRLLVNTAGYKLWHKKDDTFWIPKARVELKLTNPAAATSVKAFMLCELFVKLVGDFLNDTTYYAEVAGLNYEIHPAQNGIELTFHGFNDKIATLLDVVTSTLRSYKPQPARFELIKERHSRNLKNSQFSMPYSQLNNRAIFLVADRIWTPEEKLAALETLSADDVAQFSTAFLSSLNVEVLAMGNLTANEAREIGEKTLSNLGSQLIAKVFADSYALPSGKSYRYEHTLVDPENTNSALDYRLEIGNVTDLKQRTALSILAQIIKEPVFDQLRTKEQLGYVVGSHSNAVRSSLWLRIFAQSEETPEYLESRVEELLVTLESLLEKLSEDDYGRNVEAVVVQNLEKVKNLNEEAGRYWTAILSGYYHFARQAETAKLARTITKDQVLGLFREKVLGAQRTKLAVHLRARKAPENPADVLASRNLQRAAAKQGIELSPELLKQVQTQVRDGEDSKAVLATVEGGLASLDVAAESRGTVLASLDRSLHEPPQNPPAVGTLITDAEAFKHSLAILPLPEPVVDLVKYEADDSKL